MISAFAYPHTHTSHVRLILCSLACITMLATKELMDRQPTGLVLASEGVERKV